MNQYGDLQETLELGLGQNLKKILQHTNFCTLCLDITEDLFYLNEYLVKGDWVGEELLLKDILDVVFGEKVDFLSNFICKCCLSSAIDSYTFITRNRRTVKIYSEYLALLDAQITDLDDYECNNTLIVLDRIDNDNISDILKKNRKTINEIKTEESEKTLKKEKSMPTFICDLCGKEYIQKRSLKKHLMKHNLEAVFYGPIDCPLCKKRPCSHEKYLADVDRQMLQRKEKITCLDCNELITSTLHLIEHVNKMHLGSSKRRIRNQPDSNSKDAKARLTMTIRKPYYCIICNKDFKTLKERIMHTKQHKKKSNFCVYCNKACNSREEFLKHTQSQEHRDNMPYKQGWTKCEHCNYTTRNRHTLMAHVNRIHLKIRPYKCQYCPSTFLSSVLLKSHLKMHAGKEQRVCDICGVTLSGRRSLVMHRMRHTGEAPYCCPYCKERTNSAHSLQLHIMTRHMERTFSCPLCGTKFHTIKCLRVHIKKVHWKRPDKFDYTKLEGLSPKDYHLFEDRRKAI